MTQLRIRYVVVFALVLMVITANAQDSKGNGQGESNNSQGNNSQGENNNSQGNNNDDNGKGNGNDGKGNGNDGKDGNGKDGNNSPGSNNGNNGNDGKGNGNGNNNGQGNNNDNGKGNGNDGKDKGNGKDENNSPGSDNSNNGKGNGNDNNGKTPPPPYIHPSSPPPPTTPSSPPPPPSPKTPTLSPPPPPFTIPSSSHPPPPPPATPTPSPPPPPFTIPSSSPPPPATPTLSPPPSPFNTLSSPPPPPFTIPTSSPPPPATPTPSPPPPPFNTLSSPPPPQILAPTSPPPPSPTTSPTPSPPPPTQTPQSSPPPSTPTPLPTSPKKGKCTNTSYPLCYAVEHTCPGSCPGGCHVDCVTCKPICKCDIPGAVCQDPRFIGGDGITFYFHGKKDKDFCVVSDNNLHINAHFIGITNRRMTRDFTWVQSIGILYENHKLSFGALKTRAWDDSTDRIFLTFDDRTIFLPSKNGEKWESKSTPKTSIIRMSDANSVLIEVEGLFQISATVVPITEEDSRVHNYGITKQDCFAHLELGFKFFYLSDEVNGVLGQTYRSDYVSRVKMGVPMPVMGGAREFASSGLLEPDCSVSRFHAGKSSYADGSTITTEFPGLNCSSGKRGGGVVCKR